MQIQRIQTLFLLIAVGIMCLFCLTPYAQTVDTSGNVTDVFVKDTPVLLVVNACIAALLFINIFMYRNLRRQISLTLVSVLLLAGSAVACGFVATVGMPGAKLIWTGGVILLIATLVLALRAYRYMLRDKRKLASYDRLR